MCDGYILTSCQSQVLIGGCILDIQLFNIHFLVWLIIVGISLDAIKYNCRYKIGHVVFCRDCCCVSVMCLHTLLCTFVYLSAYRGVFFSPRVLVQLRESITATAEFFCLITCYTTRHRCVPIYHTYRHHIMVYRLLMLLPQSLGTKHALDRLVNIVMVSHDHVHHWSHILYDVGD